MTASKLSICQQALAKIRAGQIASYDETGSLEARECRRFYPQIVSNMLEGPHEWSFAKQRVVLSSAVNDRDAEWLYAYNLPSNCASPVKIIPDLTSLGVDLPIALNGEPYSEAWVTQFIDNIGMPYIIDGSKLYTNVETATLEYIIDDIDGVTISNQCANALICELAAALAVPVKGDSNREKELFTQAELAWERAIADDKNRQPTSYGNYEPENLLARHGYGDA